MNILLDTHVLIWMVESPENVSRRTRDLIQDRDNDVFFSVISLWEIELKRSLGRQDFTADPALIRRALLHEGYTELEVRAQHALAVARLASLHRDPFDRLLLCQALVEKLVLITNDELLLQYPQDVREA
jgi:PIN domain nuclease of toxin-antitoxin system